MKRSIGLYLLFALLCLAAETQAQCAKWAIAPRYNAVCRLSPTLYSIRNESGKYGVADARRGVIWQNTSDSITPLQGGYAVALKKEKSRTLIQAVIDCSGKVTTAAKGLYAMEAAHFSGGLMPVKSKRGKYGVMNTEGKLVGEFSSTPPSETATEAADAGSVAADSATVSAGPEPFLEAGLYGYVCQSDTILPAQFTEAQAFTGGYAIARTATGAGVLQYIADTLKCEVKENEREDNMEQTIFCLTTPQGVWSGGLKMHCVDSTGMRYEAEGKADQKGKYLFTIKTFRERRTFHIEATDSNGTLILWRLAAMPLTIEQMAQAAKTVPAQPKTTKQTKQSKRTKRTKRSKRS